MGQGNNWTKPPWPMFPSQPGQFNRAGTCFGSRAIVTRATSASLAGCIGAGCERIIPVDATRHPPERPGGSLTAMSAGLDEAAAPADPLTLFSSWMAEVIAADLPEPNAMVLATVSAAGWPRARTVLLKQYGPGGFVFYTNRTSTKGQELAANPRACLLFPWHPLQRQVIIQGHVTALTSDESEPYFHSRAHGSQVGAWASRQSSVLGSRGELDERYEKLERRWPEGGTVPMPEFWGGYRVAAETVEFWQGRANRLHDRLRYRREGEPGDDQHWVIERLAP
jgi:pyridoxamine 5'-phosphate oxidase